MGSHCAVPRTCSLALVSCRKGGTRRHFVTGSADPRGYPGQRSGTPMRAASGGRQPGMSEPRLVCVLSGSRCGSTGNSVGQRRTRSACHGHRARPQMLSGNLGGRQRMANSDVPDPRRGPRRFGPNAGSPTPGRPDFDDSTTVYTPPPYDGPPVERPRAQRATPPGRQQTAHRLLSHPRPVSRPARRRLPSSRPTPSHLRARGTSPGRWRRRTAVGPAPRSRPRMVAGRPSVPHPGPPAPPRRGGPGEPRRRTPGAVLVSRIVAVALAAVVLIGCGVGWALTGRLQSNSGTSDAAGQCRQRRGDLRRRA